jgi:protein SCO1
MAEAGARWYRIRGCMACHTVDGTEVVGPTLLGVTSLRDYDWFRGMVMNPDSMFINDAEARALLDLYPIPMPDQGVDELRTRAIWEYLRRVDREARMDRDDG